MPRAGLLAALAVAFTTAAGAQTPRALSPRLARAAQRPDTSVKVWVVGRPGTDLSRLAAMVEQAGGTVRRRSRFVGAVSAEVPGRALAYLARGRDVRRVQALATYVRPRVRREPAGPGALVPLLAADTLYGPGAWVARQLNVPALHTLGLFGAGVRIALLDTGFNTLHPFMATARVVAQHDFVYNDSVVRDQPGEAQGEMGHGTATWSLIAANAPGTMFGVAPAADFLLAKTEFTPTETRVEEDNWVAAVEWAESLGVDIISSSLGYLSFDGGFTYTFSQLNGDIAVTTIAADSAAARGTLVVISAGNGGPGARTINSPADADSALAVGATDSTGGVTGFSSRGPTADGRIKPDIMAPGFDVPVALYTGGLTTNSGTSFSAPLIAGLAALVQSARPGNPAFELRQGLLDASSLHSAPNNDLGSGIPDALRAYAFPVGLALTGPADSVLNTLSPVFGWRAGSPPLSAGPFLFRFRLGTDASLATPLLDTTLATDLFALPFAPPPGVRLYWRVIGISPLGVAESTAVRGPAIVPEWVSLRTLNSPRGHTTQDSLPLLAWASPQVGSPPGPFSYDVSVYPASRGPAEAVATAAGLTDTTFRPPLPLERNLPFRWRVVARLANGDSQVVTSAGTFIVVDASVPPATLLFQNFPNPFPNQALGLTTTCVWFHVREQGPVRLEIFDLRGRLIRQLVPPAGQTTVLPAGRYGPPPGEATGSCEPRFSWDGRDRTGAFVRPGVYLYRLTTPGFRSTKRIVFLGPP